MVWLLPLVGSNVIVTCLVPSTPRLWGGACGRFGWPRPACVGQCVLQRYGCCRLLAIMSSLRARHHTNMMLLFSLCKRCPCPCSDAVLRSCEEALAGIILHRPLPLVCVGPLCGSVGSRGGHGGRGPGAGRGGGDTMGGGVGARDPRAYIYIYICGHTPAPMIHPSLLVNCPSTILCLRMLSPKSINHRYLRGFLLFTYTDLCLLCSFLVYVNHPKPKPESGSASALKHLSPSQ